jgi:hypothetical protein
MSDNLEAMFSSRTGIDVASGLHAGKQDSVLSEKFFEACDSLKAKYGLNLGTGKYHELVTSEDGRISREFYKRDKNLCQLLEPVAGNRLVPFANRDEMRNFLSYTNVDPSCTKEPCKVRIDFESRANYMHETLGTPLETARAVARKHPLTKAELCKYDAPIHVMESGHATESGMLEHEVVEGLKLPNPLGNFGKDLMEKRTYL